MDSDIIMDSDIWIEIYLILLDSESLLNSDFRNGMDTII
jgi:hypothetical protein